MRIYLNKSFYSNKKGMSSELNIDFAPEKKNITMSNTTTDNLGFNTETSNMKIEEINTAPTISPNLKTADPIGVELLAKGVVSPVNSFNSSPRNDSVKSEEFSFFKPSEDKGGIIDGDLPKDDKSIDKENGFLPSYVPSPDKKKVINELKKLKKNQTKFI